MRTERRVSRVGAAFMVAVWLLAAMWQVVASRDLVT
jgi:hypothetical protein